MRIELSVRGLAKIALAIGACWLVVKLWAVVLVVVVAMMIVYALEPIVARLQATGVRRNFALALVFSGLLLAMSGFVVLTVPPLVAQMTTILTRLPEHHAHLVGWMHEHPSLEPFVGNLQAERTAHAMSDLGHYVLGLAPRALEISAYAFSALFLALYFMIDRVRMRAVVYALIPRRFHVRVARVTLELQTIVGGYIRGQALTSAFMGLFLFTLLTIARVPNAIALAALGAFGDVIPYVGVLFTIAPAALAALASKGAGTAILVAIACATYQELENRIIIPRVYGRVLRLPSSAVILALLAGGVLGGILGSILALPFAAALRMLVEELRVALPGEDRSERDLRRADAKIERSFAERAAGASPAESAAIAVELAQERLAACPPEERAATVPITSGRPEHRTSG